MATADKEILVLLVIFISCYFISEFKADALSYDYSFTHECLPNPLKPQYNGGIAINPELNYGLKGWTASGAAKVEHRVDGSGGNKFIAILRNNQPHDSISQKFYLEKEKLYTISAWLRVNVEEARIAATLKTPTGNAKAGWANAKSGCWSMLKGGFTVNSSGPAQLYFESNNTKVEIWADSISLQPFTEEQWHSHRQESIEKVRKSSVKLIAVDQSGNPIPNATVGVKVNRVSFPFGNAITKYITTNRAFQNWFSPRFGVTTFENELKWYSTESTRNNPDYSIPDAMFQFTKKNNIQVRGHNIVWDDPKFQPGWLPALPVDQIRQAVDQRVKSVVQRYAGQVISWDVVNENLHWNFYETKLGASFTSDTFKKVNALDGKPTLFLNEFNTIEESGDQAASPYKYLAKIREIRSSGYTGPLGIGLQGHFGTPNIPYVRASIDKFASTKLPIWISELDVKSGLNQAAILEQLLREFHSYPSINGIVMWAAWKPEGCYAMCLTDNNFKNLPTGDVVDKLLAEWGRGRATVGTTDSNGHFTARLFHGDYEATISHPNINSTIVHSFGVPSLDDPSKEHVVHVKV